MPYRYAPSIANERAALGPPFIAPRARTLMFHSHTALLTRNNARCLTEGPPRTSASLSYLRDILFTHRITHAASVVIINLNLDLLISFDRTRSDSAGLAQLVRARPS